MIKRVSDALRGDEVFHAENDGEMLTASLLAEIARLKALRVSDAEELHKYVENVAHEIKTPTSGLVLDLDLMENSGMTPEKLATARKCALRIGSYVNSLLTFARVQAGKVRFDFERLDLGELIGEIADDLRSNGVCVEIEGEGAEINGDRVRIREAVQNLIINASKHMKNDEPVRVGLSCTDTSASIRVFDSGEGMDVSTIERYRVGREDGASSGIGLSLAKAVAERHSGRLNIVSVPGGTQAELMIPRFSLKQSFSE